MSKINYEKFKDSLKRVKEQYENYNSNIKKFDKLVQEGIKESVIKRFEICNDTLWKYLKKYLYEVEGLVELPNSPNGVFRVAYEAGLIDKKH